MPSQMEMEQMIQEARAKVRPLIEALEWTAYGHYNPADHASVLNFLSTCQDRAKSALSSIKN